MNREAMTIPGTCTSKTPVSTELAIRLHPRLLNIGRHQNNSELRLIDSHNLIKTCDDSVGLILKSSDSGLNSHIKDVDFESPDQPRSRALHDPHPFDQHDTLQSNLLAVDGLVHKLEWLLEEALELHRMTSPVEARLVEVDEKEIVGLYPSSSREQITAVFRLIYDTAELIVWHPLLTLQSPSKRLKWLTERLCYLSGYLVLRPSGDDWTMPQHEALGRLVVVGYHFIREFEIYTCSMRAILNNVVMEEATWLGKQEDSGSNLEQGAREEFEN